MSTAEKLARFNLILTFVWIALTPPSVLFWSQSILWVIVISLWANIVGHFSAYIAARAERSQQQGYNLTELDKKWLAHLIQFQSQSSSTSSTTSQLPVITRSTSTASPTQD